MTRKKNSRKSKKNKSRKSSQKALPSKQRLPKVYELPDEDGLPLYAALQSYITCAAQPFTLSQIADKVISQLSEKEEDAQNIIHKFLQVSDLVFHDSAQDIYIPRHLYFDKTKFRVRPTSREIAEGILIPGHRFIPFCSPQVYPFKCQLLLPDGSAVPSKTTQWTFNDLLFFHAFFHMPDIVILLEADQPKNQKLLHKLDRLSQEEITKLKFTFTAFDMAEVYTKLNFKDGDTLALTVQDWNQGIYTLEHFEASNNPSLSHRRNCVLLEESVLKVCDDLGVTTSVREQLSQALFIGGKQILEFPGIHFGGWLEQCQHIGLINIGRTSILWKKGEAPSPGIAFLEPNVSFKGDMDKNSIEGILFNEFGVCLFEPEIEAYMRDALYNDENLDSVIDQICPGLLDGEVLSKQKEKKVLDSLNRLWAKVQASYDRDSDKEASVYRSQAISILDSYMLFSKMASVGTTLFNLFSDHDMMHQFTQIAMPLQNILMALNQGDEAVKGMEKHISRKLDECYIKMEMLDEDMEQKLGFSKDMLEETVENLENFANFQDLFKPPANKSNKPVNKPDKRGKPKKTSKKKQPDNQVYQLRIELEYIKPPIWRRVQVLGGTTLSELHEIIQESMGWGNYHLHVFNINGVEYESPESDDFGGGGFGFDMEREDESNFTLSELVPKSGFKFFYEYDFGDSWEHKITVEEILPVEEEKNYPICLDGKNACPPEDCGGFPGFEHLLTVMKNPRNREYKEMVEWLGEPFVPNEFDIDEVNDRLQEFYK